jgi:hypothetical protein
MCAGKPDPLVAAAEEALAAVRLEGEEPSEEAMALLEQLAARGKTSAAEEIAQLLQRYQR